jgi:polyribonucleotide 5'-hydroxyl-kinase
VKSRAEEDEAARQGGVFIDTPGSIAAGKSGNYEYIQHIISEFGVNIVLVLGSERLANDLKKKVDSSTTIIRLDKSRGCVDRDETYMKELRTQQIKEYFGLGGTMALDPRSYELNFADLTIYRIAASTPSNHPTSTTNDNDEDDFYEPSATISVSTNNTPSTTLEKITASNMMQNSLLAVTFASPNASPEMVRDAATMGYVYVQNVDEGRRRIVLTSPMVGVVPRNAMVWGSWPESVVGLVSG